MTKAQATTGRKEVWTYTAVVLVAGLRYALADATTDGLWLQVAALLASATRPRGGAGLRRPHRSAWRAGSSHAETRMWNRWQI